MNLKRMKAILIIMLVMIMTSGCASKETEGRAACQNLYNIVMLAHENTTQMASEVIGMYELGKDGSFKYEDVKRTVSLSDAEIKQGVIDVLNDVLPDLGVESHLKDRSAGEAFMMYTALPALSKSYTGDNYFSASNVLVTITAYKRTDTYANAKKYMEAAQAQVDMIKENYPECKEYDETYKYYYAVRNLLYEYGEIGNSYLTMDSLQNFLNDAAERKESAEALLFQ